MSMDFLKMIEGSGGEEHSIVFLVSHKYTSGSHGWGDKPEVRASDPVSSARYEFKYDREFEKLISPYAHTVDYAIHEGGSFHERWYYASARVHLLLPWDMSEEFNVAKQEHKIKTDAYDALFSEGPEGFWARQGTKFWRGEWRGFDAAERELREVAESYNQDKMRQFKSSKDFWDMKINSAMALHSLKRPLEGD